jgi:hypothetical protein
LQKLRGKSKYGWRAFHKYRGGVEMEIRCPKCGQLAIQCKVKKVGKKEWEVERWCTKCKWEHTENKEKESDSN